MSNLVGLHGTKRDAKTAQAESSEFPILCETCLGPNPLVRMIRDKKGSACKICERPFTSFSWKPGPKARYKKTVLCQGCARQKHVCQTCVLDLTYGLPVQVRDSIISKNGGGQELAPAVSAKNKEHVRQMEQQLAESGMDSGSHGDAPYHEALLRMARRKPYYERNRPKLCTFFARGECNRGDECPFVHEMPRESDDPLRKQNIRDRFAGTNDPVAAKILGRMQKTASKLSAPRDTDIKTLWAGGLDAQTTEQELRDAFYAYGELKRVRLMAKQRCAFIEYTTREAAEAAADALHRNLTIRGARIKIAWAAKQRRGATGSKAGDISAGASAGGDAHTMPAPPGAPGGVAAQYRLPGKGGKVTTKKGAAIPPPPPPPQGGNGGSGAAAAAADKPKYPSLDPSTFGARTSIA